MDHNNENNDWRIKNTKTIMDALDSKIDHSEYNVRRIKNYMEFQNLIVNLAKDINDNSDDEKCEKVTLEFVKQFAFYLNEINIAERSLIINFFRDTNIGVETVKETQNNVKPTFERRYNQHRQFALVRIKDETKFNNNFSKSYKKETINLEEVKLKKISEKWHALLYWIELTANGQRPPINNEGSFIKSEIEKIGMEKTGTTGQSFYRQFKDIDLNNSKELIGMFGKDWKQKIIRLSNNNQTVIDYIELKFKQ